MRSRKPLAERLLPGCDSVISDRAGSLQTIVRFGRMPVIAESNHRDIIELPFEKKRNSTLSTFSRSGFATARTGESNIFYAHFLKNKGLWRITVSRC